MYGIGEQEGLDVIPDDIQDLSFRIDARTLPVDHAEALSTAVLDWLPWMRDDSSAAIQLIHSPESGHGWNRPTDPGGEHIYVSRRARLMLRLPKQRLDDARRLTDQSLDISGHTVKIGKATSKLLVPTATLLSRRVVCDAQESEQSFVASLADSLAPVTTKAPTILCGRLGALKFAEEEIFVRSVMLADLDAEDSIRLQQKALGRGRLFGCGLFLPHKSTAPLNESG